MKLARGALLIGWLVLAAGCQTQEASKSKDEPVGITSAAAGFRVGEERRYRLHFESEASIRGEPLTQFVLDGAWVLTPLTTADGAYSLHARVEGARLTTKYEALARELGALEPELAVPFGIELSRGAEVVAYRFSDAPSTLVVGIRQALAAAFQAVDETGSVTWTREELDATGRYRASYERQVDGTLLKRKLEYTQLEASRSVPTADASELLPKVPLSRQIIALDARGALVTLNSEERLESGGGQIAPVNASSKLELRLEAQTTLAPAAADRLREQLAEASRFASDAVWKSRAGDEQFDPARIGGRTLAGVLADLRALRNKTPVGSALPEKERADLFTALTAIIRSQPESRQKVVDLVKQADPLTDVLLDALGAAGVHDAQTALAGFLDSGVTDEKQLRIAAIALSHTKNVSPEATTALVKLLNVKGLRTQALYGLGTQVSTLRAAGQDARAKEVLALILDRLKVADDPIKLVTALRAVANAGDASAFPMVDPYLRSTDSVVRAAAVESLQEMSLPQADEIISRALSSDEDSQVRRAAARAASERAPSPLLVTAASRAALTDKNPHVRLSALAVLGRYLPRQPEVRSAIETVAAKDAEDAIRKEAAKMLGSVTP